MSDQTKPLVYVAGPYSNPDPVENTHAALAVGDTFMRGGVVTPIVPHLTMTWHLVFPHPYEQWLAYDLEVMRRCDAVYRIVGPSSGADAEVAEAEAMGLPVFHEIADLYAWANA